MSLFNTPMGLTNKELDPPERCAKCGKEITGEIRLVTDGPLYDAVLCEDCAYRYQQKAGK